MADNVFVVKTKDKIKIRLTKTQWKHIAYRHPEMSDKLQEMRDTVLNPTARRRHSDEIVKFYKFLKAKKKYIMVAVKILNNEGFVVTAYQTLRIQKSE